MPANGELKEEPVTPLSAEEIETVDEMMSGPKSDYAPLSPAPSTPSSVYDDADDAAMAPPRESSTALPAQPADLRTIIVYDWDDTLLSSSHLASLGHTLDSTAEFGDELAAELSKLAQCVINVLEAAMQHGTVVIITNAETGWVQLSAQRFIPAVVPIVSQLTVVSARSTYEAVYPDSPLRWKYSAFHDRLTHLLSGCDRPRQLLSLGDSQVEREACRAVGRVIPRLPVKSVKFAERPSLPQLLRELELVHNCFGSIVTHDGDLDLMLTISLMQPQAGEQQQQQSQQQHQAPVY